MIRERLLATVRGYRPRAVPDLPGGLPAIRTVVAFPLLLLVAGSILVGFALNGSSSGAMRAEVTSSTDPDLLIGAPERIRTDEWNVQTVWAISQVQQGLPNVNETFPGGMDATIPQDLPRSDWTVAFRPHLLGFNFLDLDRAIAWKWWVPGLGLIAAAYVFMVTVMPRRPVVAAAVSVGFFFSPLFQWWYLPTTLWPVVWGFSVMTGVLWSVRSYSRRGAWVWAAIAAYLTVVMAMGIYVPYILPVVIVAAFFVVGVIVAELRSGRRVLELALRIAPTAAAGAVGGAVTAYWLYTRRDTVDAFLSTAYPGERLTPTGASGLTELTTSLASSFTQALKAGGLLGQNPSEASTVFFVGAFLIPVIVWACLREKRRGGPQPWLLIAVASSIVLIFAFVHVPGWDGAAHLLLLDRMTGNRARIGVAVASIAIVPLLIRYLDDTASVASRAPAAALAAAFFSSQVLIAVALGQGAPDSLAAATRWWVYALLGAAVIYLFCRARPGPAAAAFLALTVLGSATVNPLYRGVYDLRQTAVGRAVLSIDKQVDHTWVGVGDRLTTAVLVETGVRAYNGFQGAPSSEMWSEIDPTGRYEFEWNRLAGVSWTPGVGEPVVVNPYADQISVTFDACSTFAQENVDFVLSDRSDDAGPCLDEIESFRIVGGELVVYRVDEVSRLSDG